MWISNEEEFQALYPGRSCALEQAVELTDADRYAILSRRDAGESLNALAKEYGIKYLEAVAILNELRGLG